MGMRFAGRKVLPRLSVARKHTAAFSPPVIQISNGTFYRHHPNSIQASTSNPPLFEQLSFTLQSFPQSDRPQHTAIIGPSSSGKTTFLHILRGQHVCIPPSARSWPYLEPRPDRPAQSRTQAIKYVGFDGEQGLGGQGPKGAYLSARYESRREDTDFSVLDYLQGNTELNPFKDADGVGIDSQSLDRVVKDLRLTDLVDMPVSNLSNGQTRRARIAKALLGNPEALLLDEPFMGLDPPTLLTLSPLLYSMAKTDAPRIVMTLRPQDPIPDWITNIYYLKGNCQIAYSGPKEDVLEELRRYIRDIKEGRTEPNVHMPVHSISEVGRKLTSHGIVEPVLSTKSNLKIPTAVISKAKKPSISDSASDGGNEIAEEALTRSTLSRDGYRFEDTEVPEFGEPLVEMEGARVQYGSKAVLGNWKQDVNGNLKDGLWWAIRRGERWGIFGPNGSGKTTILSLICSDHPQTYSLPIRLFGRSRLPEPGQRGISIWDIQSRIGHSSPEIHNHMPRSLTLRQVLENAWAETMRGVPKLDANAKDRIDACLRWFEQDLRPGIGSALPLNEHASLDSHPTWANDILFGGMPFSGQRIALFLRAIIKRPDLVILDEAFSGMDEGVRDRCLLFLSHGETKMFSEYVDDGQHVTLKRQREVVESDVSKAGRVKVKGLGKEQALLCISHVREEIPGCVREWICLPESNQGKPARFGRLNGPLEGDYRRWNEIWGLPQSPR